jgi:O-acetyl-ADP-ribose deacetylase (regulator of RNase III)
VYYHCGEKNMVKIEIVEGDITGVSADALVNAANNYLWMGAGVAGAIKKAGGTHIEDEAVRKGPITVGTVVETGAGFLPVKFIIHAAVMGQDLHTSAMIIEHSTINSLRKAEELGLKNIAFPALGTGVGGFSLEECAQIMIRAALEYKGINKLEKIIFVLHEHTGYRIFTAELARQAGS